MNLTDCKVGVVVPFYNGNKYIERLLSSILNSRKDKFYLQIVIVDNGIEEIELSILERYGDSIIVLKEKLHLGYGKACNIGMDFFRYFSFDYIVVLNQDGHVSENMINDVLQPLIIDKNIFLSVPIIKEYDGTSIEDFFIKYYISQCPDYFNDLLIAKAKPWYGIDKISGACFAMRVMSVVELPYLFDENFHMYYEDEDLSRRIILMNKKIVLISGDSCFFHQHSNTTDLTYKNKITKHKVYSLKVLYLKDLRNKMVIRFIKLWYLTFGELIKNFILLKFRLFGYEIFGLMKVVLRLGSISKKRILDLRMISDQK